MIQKYLVDYRIRGTIILLYFLNFYMLAIYLMIVPIQVAFYWLIATQDTYNVQAIVDAVVIGMYTMHMFLGVDNYLVNHYRQKQQHKFFANPLKKFSSFLSLEIIYDIACLILAIVILVKVKVTIVERAIQLVFFFKVYKLSKFDDKCLHTVIGSSFYFLYKITRTLFIVFITIAYVGSLFYGVDYVLYLQNVYYSDLLWIVSTGAIDQLVQNPFGIQLEYTMYWALSTASTAAYGDISAADPIGVLLNIFALIFQGFLFGFYMNSMHSIPMQLKTQQLKLLQKFDSFYRHSSTKDIDQKLYLQILSSIQYQHNRKINQKYLQTSIPQFYLKQVKYYLYYDFINNNFHKSLFQTLQNNIVNKINQIVCQQGQNIYQYQGVSNQKDDLFFISQGIVKFGIGSWQIKQFLTNITINKGYSFGYYSFLTGITLPQTAICQNYSKILIYNRKSYKQLLTQMKQKLIFMKYFNKALIFDTPLTNLDPYQIYKINQQQIVIFYQVQKRQFINRRQYKKNKKKIIIKQQKYKNIFTQTQNNQDTINLDIALQLQFNY